MIVLTCLVVFSSISFLFFGIGCFTTQQMKNEFIRYGLDKWRTTVGVLQLLGATGLLIGYFYFSMLGLLAAGGLTLLMLLGFGVRLKIKDNILQSAPSLLFAILNAFIVYKLYLNMYIF